jgi:hypothetical protein
MRVAEGSQRQPCPRSSYMQGVKAQHLHRLPCAATESFRGRSVPEESAFCHVTQTGRACATAAPEGAFEERAPSPSTRINNSRTFNSFKDPFACILRLFE